MRARRPDLPPRSAGRARPIAAAAGGRVHDLGRRWPMAPLALGVTLYSVGPVLVQASSVSGAVFSFWRLWLGVVVLGGATLLHGRATGRWPDARGWRWSVGAGAAFGGHQLLMFIAIKATTVADVTLVSTLSPVVTAVMAAPFFGERPGWTFRLWSVVAMAGTAVVVAGGAAGPEGNPLGMALALGNVVFFAAFFLLSKGSRPHLDVLPFLFGVIVVAALTVSAYVVVTGGAIGAVTRTDLLYALIVASGPGAIGHFVTTWPLRWIPANVPPVMRLAVPVLAGLWAWWFLGEAVTVWHLAGGVLTIGGVAGALLSRSGRRFVAGDRAPADSVPRGR